MEVKEHFDSDISGLLNDKQRLLEQLDSERLRTQQLERDFEALKQIKSAASQLEEDTMKKNYAESFEQLQMEKVQLETSLNELRQRNQALEKDLLQETNQSKDLNLLMSNQQLNISSLKEDLSSLRDTLARLQTLFPDVDSTNFVEHVEQVLDHRREIQEQVKQQEETIQREQQRIEQLTNELQSLKEHLSNDHEAHLQTLRSDYDGRMADLNNQLQQSQETKDQLQQSLDEASERHTKDKQSTGEWNFSTWTTVKSCSSPR